MKLDARAGLRAAYLVSWYAKGKPAPPPGSYKRRYLRRLGKRYKLGVFVETGTLHGETIDALQKDFRRLYSIELSAKLSQKASDRFKNCDHIDVLHGDSAEQIPRVLQEIDEAALFWLDAHFSGGETTGSLDGSPIVSELKTILNHSYNHVIVIDDMRLFGTEPGYPEYNVFRNSVENLAGNRAVEVANDLMTITPSICAR
jgi:hypothetical protein